MRYSILSMCILFLCWGNSLWAQQPDTFYVSGTVNISNSGQTVPGFHIGYLVAGTSFFYTSQTNTDANGDYQYEVVVPSGDTACVFMFYNDCTINTNPNSGQVDFSPLLTDTVYNISICQNLNCSANFTYDSLPGSPLSYNFTAIFPGLNSYSWDFGDGTTASGQTVSHTYSLSGTYIVCLVVDDGAGCVDTSCVPIFVGSSPPPPLCDASFSLLPTGGPLNCFSPDNPSPTSVYLWDFGDGTTSTDMIPCHAFPGSGVYQVCLTVTDALTGCVDSSCQSVVSGGNVCNALFSYTIPIGTTVDFFDLSFGDGPLTYAWDFGDGNTSTQANPTHQYAVDSTYYVCLTITDTTGCTSTYCDFVNVGCLASISFLPDPTDSLTVTFTGYPAGMNSYTWDLGDGTVANGQSVTHTYGATGTYVVCLAVDNGAGCVDTACFQITLTGSPPPPYPCDADFFYWPDPNGTICFQPIFPPLPGILNYQWDFGDGNTSYDPIPCHTYATADTFLACLIVSDPGLGCSDTFCETIIVPTAPSCDASFFPIYSPGGSLCFSPLQSNLFYQYQWDFGDGSTSTDPVPCHQFGPTVDSSLVCLIITDSASGCSDTTCLMVYPSLGGCSAQFTSTPGNNPDEWIFVANDTTMLNYSWDFDGGTIVSSINPWSAVVQYNNPGVRNVCLAADNGNGCIDFYCEVILVGSGSPCSAAFTFTSTGNNTLSFLPLLGTANVGASYFWDFGDGNTDTTVNPVHTYAAAGSYQVCLTVVFPGGCVDTSCQLITTYPSNPPNTLPIFGQVFAGNNPADEFIAYLIEYDSAAGTLTAIDTFSSSVAITGLAGFFQFHAPAGSYFVKVALEPASQFYANYLPTYFGDELFWYNALPVDPNTFPFISIDMVAGANPGGPGFVGGLVSQGANKNGDPLGNMTVIITHLDDSPLTYTITKDDGTYELDNLPYGTYKVWVEMWGRDLNYYIITLSADNPSITGLDFEITDTEVIAGSSTGLDQFLSTENGWNLFPNPASEWVQVVLDMKESTEVILTVANVLGQELYRSTHAAFAGENQFSVPVGEMKEGIYLVQVEIQGSRLSLGKLTVRR